MLPAETPITDRGWVNELVDLVDRTTQTVGNRRAKLAPSPVHQQLVADMHRIELQSAQHESCRGSPGRLLASASSRAKQAELRIRER